MVVSNRDLRDSSGLFSGDMLLSGRLLQSFFFASFVNMFGEVMVLSKDLVKHHY